MSLIVCPTCGKTGVVPDWDFGSSYEVACPDCQPEICGEPDDIGISDGKGCILPLGHERRHVWEFGTNKESE